MSSPISAVMPCDAWFEPIEFEERVSRVRKHMDEREIDCLLVTSEQNFTYLTGVQTPSFISKTRPLALILPVVGRATIVVAKSHVVHSAVCSWIDDVRGFDGFEPESLPVLARALDDAGAGRGRIGCELGAEQRLGMSFLGFQALRDLLPEARFVDASESLWATRAVKSATEILYLREVGRITGLAFDAAIATARHGATELEAFREFAATCLKMGASRPGYFSMHSGRGQDTRSNRWPSERRLERGDLVWMDAGASYRGYWSDYTRMVSLGEPSQAQAESYRFVFDVSRAILSLVRPGVTCEELMQECRREFASTGRQIGNATRIGHGVGMDLTEPPSVVEGDTTRLEPGMVLAVEPGLRTDLGYFVVEENIVVTDSGFEYLSIPAPALLPVND